MNKKYPFITPNYNHSIVNLMSSISASFGKKHDYNELTSLTSKELNAYKNIVLIVFDGLGYNYLKKQKNSFLYSNLKDKISSTFLSTTVCANTTFCVGYPPQQHGLTGWDMHLKEVGSAVTILPFMPMYKGHFLVNSGFDINQIMNIDSFHKSFKGNCFTVIDQKIANSSFTKYVAKHTKIIPTKTCNDSFDKLKKLIKTNNTSKKRFFHIYVPDIDSMAHDTGINSKHTNELFLKLDKKIKNLVSSIKNTDTKIIITADHGMIDSKIIVYGMRMSHLHGPGMVRGPADNDSRNTGNAHS